MKQLKFCILAAAFLIAGAILTGCALIAGGDLIFLGFACMLLGCLLPFAEQIASYCKTFFGNNGSNDSK